MVYWRVSPEQTSHQVYLKSLSAVPPNVSSWPKSLQENLIGSNVYAVIDESGEHRHVDGNVSVIKNLLAKLDRIRTVIAGKQRQQQQEQHHPKGQDARTRSTLDPQDSVSSLFTVLEEGPGPCIFTEESLRWARGHFLSRRFPATMPNLVNLHHHAQVADDRSSIGSKKDHHHHHHHLAGYGDATSMFIPVLDLMNHTPMRNNACSLKMTPDGMHLQVFSGDLALQCGDELFYCYSSAETGGLSNEILLQGYGFCLADNPADTVSVKISTMDGEQCRGGNAFWIGRGGVSAIPSAMWKALAGIMTKESLVHADNDKNKHHDDNNNNNDQEESIEIGSGDLNLLLQYMTNKLVLLNGVPATEALSFKTEESDVERLAYIEMYKNGQREILVELIRDLKLMLEEYNSE